MRVYSDRDSCCRRPAIAVADCVRNDIGAVEIGIRRIRDCAVGVEHDRAIGRTGRRDRQRVAIGIDIRARSCQHADCDRRIFCGHGGIVIGLRTDVGDGPDEGGADATAIAVVSSHRHKVDAAIYLACARIDGAGDLTCHPIDAQPIGQA